MEARTQENKIQIALTESELKRVIACLEMANIFQNISGGLAFADGNIDLANRLMIEGRDTHSDQASEAGAKVVSIEQLRERRARASRREKA
jgi:hypothetical protein